MKTGKSFLYHANSVDWMSKCSGDSMDLIITSPPYANARSHTYGGIDPDEYVEWFDPYARVMLYILKPSGSFILNIKEGVVKGERHTYVLDLVKLMQEVGWRWTEEYIWCKKNAMPGKWKDRFRDSWERILHFTKTPDFKMRQDAVMVPRKDGLELRVPNDRETRRDKRNTGSRFSSRRANWIGRDMAYPSNVLHIAPETHNKGHSAVMPEAIPKFFIKLFTDEGDVVLDPFCGSGTVPYVAKMLNRKGLGIDKDIEAIKVARKRTAQENLL